MIVAVSVVVLPLTGGFGRTDSNVDVATVAVEAAVAKAGDVLVLNVVSPPYTAINECATVEERAVLVSVATPPDTVPVPILTESS